MKKSKLLALVGPKRGGVRVIESVRDGESVVLVKWRLHGVRRQESYPATPAGRLEAKAFAQGVWDSRKLKPRPAAPSVRQLFQLYAAAEYPALRPRTQANYKARWKLFEVFAGHDRPADLVTMEHLDNFRGELRRQKTRRKRIGYAPNQVKHIVRIVKLVFRWARQRKLLATDLPDYRFKMAKEERAAAPAEYSREEFEKLVAELDPRKPNEWRPWALLMFIGHQGVRENAALKLKWSDLVGADVSWRAETDKVGKAWTQPLRWGALAALETARWWRGELQTKRWYRAHQLARSSAWVFPTARPGRGDHPYTAQALARAIWQAEERAGVVHKDLRALHGLRRMVAGDIYALTGSEKAALDFIGDRDVRLIPTYLRERPGALAELAQRIDEHQLGGGKGWTSSAEPGPEVVPSATGRNS